MLRGRYLQKMGILILHVVIKIWPTAASCKISKDLRSGWKPANTGEMSTGKVNTISSWGTRKVSTYKTSS